MGDIEMFFESHSEALDSKTKDCIEKFIQKMDPREGKYYDGKLHDIKLLIYN